MIIIIIIIIIIIVIIIVVDGDWTYHLAVWVGKDIDYLSHVL